MKSREERTAYAVGMMEKHKEYELDMKEKHKEFELGMKETHGEVELDMKEKCKEYEVGMKEKKYELEMVIIESELELSKALATHLGIEEAKILAERQGKELLRRERMFWAEKVARDDRKRLKEVEIEKKIMIHKHANYVTNHEKDTECLNTRLSAMESNFDEERAKYHNNLNKVKASVKLETHKEHQQKILRRELVAKDVEKRK